MKFHETSSFFALENVKNEANRSNSRRISSRMDSWVQNWRPVPMRFAIFSVHVEKVHASMARSAFGGKNGEHTATSEMFWKLRRSKSARDSCAKHRSKSKCRTLLEIEMSKSARCCVHTLYFIPCPLHSTLYTLDLTLCTTLYTPHTTLDTLHFTLHTLHFTLHTGHSTTLYTLHSTLYTLHFTLHTLHLTAHTRHSTLYTLQTLDFTLCMSHFTLDTPHSTLYNLQFTLHSTLCTLHFTLYTWHATLVTLYFTYTCIP